MAIREKQLERVRQRFDRTRGFAGAYTKSATVSRGASLGGGRGGYLWEWSWTVSEKETFCGAGACYNLRLHTYTSYA